MPVVFNLFGAAALLIFKNKNNGSLTNNDNSKNNKYTLFNDELYTQIILIINKGFDYFVFNFIFFIFKVYLIIQLNYICGGWV